MRIDGIFLPDVPVLSAALSDDLVLVVQRSGLLVQSYQNLTSTYYAIAGEIKIPGINLPTVRIATSQPTDELVLIVENSGLAVKQIGFNAPVMSDGSKIAVPGIGIPSVRFSGTIDGDEYVLAVRANNLCLIPIPSSFSAGALPTAGQTFYASLKTSLVPEVGTGGPTWSRATAAWRFNDIGLLRQIPSGCAEFGGARLVVNTVRTKSEDFSNAAWAKNDLTTPSANTLLCANATSAQNLSQGGAYPAVTIGQSFVYGIRAQYVNDGVAYIQISANGTGFGPSQYINVSLLDGSFNAVGCTGYVTLVSSGVYDIALKVTATTSGNYDGFTLGLANSLSDTRFQAFVGDGIKSVNLLRAWSVDVTGRDASYIPEYVSVGVLSSPYHGAGTASTADGCKYFETDWQGAPIPAANLLRFRKEASATNNILRSRKFAFAANDIVSGGAWKCTDTVGPELITNGTFDADTDWTKGSGWTIGAGVASGVNNDATLNQVIAGVTPGKTYVITYTITMTAGFLIASLGSPANNTGGTRSAAGTYTDTIRCGTNTTLYFYPFGGFSGTVDNVSIKECAIQVGDATGIDGIANTATILTATAADATILQPTSGIASAARCASAYVKRVTGTGAISFTQDGGSTWTDITAQINSSTWSRVQITSTLANPSVGFKLGTSGDAIEVDCVQNEAGAVATSPIVTTTTTVNRSADSLTDQTSGNWSDTAGTAYILAKPVVYSGGAVGSATNGLLLSASNSGATAYDGTNSANGPTGTPGAVEKLALAWGSSTMSVASSGLVGTPGTYDGAMGLSSIGVGVGAVGYFGDVAIYNYKMTDAELQAITT